MSLDEIWRAAAADNPEARDYLARYERDMVPAHRAAVAASRRLAPPPPAETRDELLFAIEYEMQKAAPLVAELADGPHQRTDLFRMLTPVHPRLYRSALVQSLTELALQLERDGDLEAAVTHLDEALDHSRELLQQDRDNALALCLYQRARISLGLNRREEALRCLREAATLAAADDEVISTCARMRSTMLEAYTSIALNEGNRAEAMSLLTEHADVLRSLAERDPAELPDLAMTLNNLGALRFEDNQTAGRAIVTEAVAIRRDLAAADPGTHLPGLSAALNNLGFLGLRMGDLDTAQTSLAEAVSIRRGLTSGKPDTYGPQLLRSLNNLVLVLLSRKTAQPGDLLDATAEARALAEQLASRHLCAAHDIALTLLHFAEARVLARRELPAAKAAVDNLLSSYDMEASATGLHQRATTLRNLLATC
ncbi:hypothetical protein [Actinomadura sp. 6N118]|uniref:hypothetical protein n=1 Tax=Actinomadura sp. 6N118 TaxID=3375151 RepID=UPI0037B74E43